MGISSGEIRDLAIIMLAVGNIEDLLTDLKNKDEIDKWTQLKQAGIDLVDMYDYFDRDVIKKALKRSDSINNLNTKQSITVSRESLFLWLLFHTFHKTQRKKPMSERIGSWYKSNEKLILDLLAIYEDENDDLNGDSYKLAVKLCGLIR